MFHPSTKKQALGGELLQFSQWTLPALPSDPLGLLPAYLFLTQECIYPTGSNTQHNSSWDFLAENICVLTTSTPCLSFLSPGHLTRDLPKVREAHWPKEQTKETGPRYYSRLHPCINSLVLINQFPLQVFLP